MPSNKKKKNDFTYKVENELPTIAIKTEWDLASLYYKSAQDPQIEADVVQTEKAYANFAKKWRTKDYLNDTNLLLESLIEYEKLSASPFATRPMRYFWLRTCLNTNDNEAEGQMALISRRLRKVGDLLLFYTLNLGKISKAQQKLLLKDKTLAHYHYHLKRLFRGSVHNLTEPEEKIINLKSRQSYSMWVDMTDKIISNRHIAWKGKKIALPEATEMVSLVEFKDRQPLWQKILTEFKQISEVAEHEFNAIVTDAHAENERRGYKEPYDGTVIAYEDTNDSLLALVKAVSDKGFALSRKFYEIKANYHKVTSLNYAERNAPIGEELMIPWEQAVSICRDVFYSLKNDYGVLFDEMLTRGQIDVFPKAGKGGGAFMSDQTGHPIQVMLNHLPNLSSLETLAHEMGHAIHAKCSSTNSSFYDGHSTITAETASTLFENLVFDAILKNANHDQKIYLLHHRLLRDVSTIQRQIAFFNTELEIHRTIIEKGATTKEELASITEKNLRAYLGKAVNVTPDDGYSFVGIPHLRYGFYVYTYSYGLLMSSIMSNNYSQDNKYIKTIDKFLHRGASDTVANIFNQAGIDTTNPETFAEALVNQENNIKAFARLIKK